MIAGSLNTYLDGQISIEIEMFSKFGKAKFFQVDNVAEADARIAVFSIEKEKQVLEIVRHVNYIEHTAEKGFTNVFAKSLMLE